MCGNYDGIVKQVKKEVEHPYGELAVEDLYDGKNYHWQPMFKVILRPRENVYKSTFESCQTIRQVTLGGCIRDETYTQRETLEGSQSYLIESVATLAEENGRECRFAAFGETDSTEEVLLRIKADAGEVCRVYNRRLGSEAESGDFGPAWVAELGTSRQQHRELLNALQDPSATVQIKMALSNNQFYTQGGNPRQPRIIKVITDPMRIKHLARLCYPGPIGSAQWPSLPYSIEVARVLRNGNSSADHHQSTTHPRSAQ